MKNKSTQQSQSTPQYRPHHAEKLLIKLHHKKYITQDELRAGLRYARDFALSGMTGHFAHVHYDVVGINGTPAAHANDNFTPSEMQIAARQRLKIYDRLLGPLMAGCFYHIIGMGYSMRDFAHRAGHGGYAGVRKSLSPSEVMGILLSGLSLLAQRQNNAF